MAKNTNIDVFATSSALNEEEIRGKTVVIIDVLRTSTTIVTALANGAKAVIPAEDMGAAGKIAQNLDTDNALLCGEKDSKKIQGYDLGNSPSEYTKETVDGKSIILSTTNGTKAIVKCANAENVYIAGFTNISAVARLLKKEKSEILIICAGWKGRLSLEDSLCAGQLVHQIFGGVIPVDAKDGAKAVAGLYERFRDEIVETVAVSNHAKRLAELGLESDINACTAVDVYKFVPHLNDGVILK